MNPGNVAGQIDVTITYDVPAGTNVSAVRATLDGTEVCRQSFTTGGSADAAVEGAQVPQQLICSINTARLNANGTPVFANGTHTLKAELLNATGGVVASATYQPMTFNNIDLVAAAVTTTKGPVTGPGGLVWRGGDLTVALTPSIYSGTANSLASLTVTIAPSANAAIQGTGTSSTANFNAGCATTGRRATGTATATCVAGTLSLTDNTPADGFSVTFPAATRYALGGSGNLEDPNLTITVNGVTTSGQNYAGNANVTIGGVANNTFAGGVWTPNAANILRFDNLAPRVTNFAIVPNQYINGTFGFGSVVSSATCPNDGTVASATAQPCYRTVDYGVDSQTSTFNILTTSGGAVTNGAGVTNASAVAETPTSTSYVAQAVVTDLLGNSRSVYSASAAGATTTDITVAAQFGVDLTPPTVALTGNGKGVATAPAAGANNTFTFTATDAAVPPGGPSGISGISVKVEQITPSGTVCLDPATGAAFVAGAYGYSASNATSANACGSLATVTRPNPATVVLPDVNAYYRISATPVDIAGNAGTTTQVVQLRDFTAPGVGGIVSPSTITGNTDVTFTSAFTDNVDLGDATPSVSYTENAVATELQYPSSVLGTYGFDALTSAVVGNFTIPQFIRSIETTAANVPSGTISRATAVNAYVRDVAGVQLGDLCAGLVNASSQNCTNRQDAILANVATGIGGAGTETSFGAGNRPFAAVSGTNPNGGGTAFTFAAPSNANVCSDVSNANTNLNGGGCPTSGVTKTSTTLTATATGPAQTFANPFQRVVFYYVDPNTGRAIPACTGSVTVSDNTTNGIRTWTYSCTPANLPDFSAGGTGTAVTYFALGIDSTGRALKSGNQAVTFFAD